MTMKSWRLVLEKKTMSRVVSVSVCLLVWTVCCVGQRTTCMDGFWGDNCQNTCSSHCQGRRCHSDTGRCLTCRIHFAEPDCTECMDGYYLSASDECFYCGRQCYNNSACNKRTGKCDRCPVGHRGDSCNMMCEIGRYGQDCGERCGHCEEQTCDTVTGLCQHCQPGYQLPDCKQACQNNTYGTDCAEQCGHCADDMPCQHENGHCEKCMPGKIATQPVNYCREDCTDGKYGQDCAEDCGHCSDDIPCDKVTGKCLRCVHGLRMPLCQESAGDDNSGELRVLIGVLVGAAFVIVLLAVAVLCWRRNFRSRASGRAAK